MYKKYLALNNLQWLMCHKTKLLVLSMGQKDLFSIGILDVTDWKKLVFSFHVVIIFKMRAHIRNVILQTHQNQKEWCQYEILKFNYKL